MNLNCYYYITPIDNYYREIDSIRITDLKKSSFFNNDKFRFSNFFLKDSKIENSKTNHKESTILKNPLNDSSEISEINTTFDDSFGIDERSKFTESFEIDWKKCIKMFKKFSFFHFKNIILKKIDIKSISQKKAKKKKKIHSKKD